MHKRREVYAVMRCPSVCLSICHVRETSSRILIFFSPSARPTILVFSYQMGWQFCDTDPLTGASNARGYVKITIFDQYLALSRKWCKIAPYSGPSNLYNDNIIDNIECECPLDKSVLSVLLIEYNLKDDVQKTATADKYAYSKGNYNDLCISCCNRSEEC